MPCEVLGAGTATIKQLRGELYNVHPTAAWGLEEVKKPHLFICTISDADEATVRPIVDAHAGETDGYTGPRWIMTPAEVNNADGKSYTLTEFQSFLTDQS